MSKKKLNKLLLRHSYYVDVGVQDDEPKSKKKTKTIGKGKRKSNSGSFSFWIFLEPLQRLTE